MLQIWSNQSYIIIIMRLNFLTIQYPYWLTTSFLATYDIFIFIRFLFLSFKQCQNKAVPQYDQSIFSIDFYRYMEFNVWLLRLYFVSCKKCLFMRAFSQFVVVPWASRGLFALERLCFVKEVNSVPNVLFWLLGQISWNAL